MTRLFLATFLSFVFCFKGIAATLGLGLATSLPTSPVDHFKYGPSLSFSLFEKSKWQLKGSAELISISFSPVNPGALPSSSAPDQTETSSASSVFVGDAWLQTPATFLGGLLSLGSISYFPDYFQAPAIGVPVSFATQVAWTFLGKQDSRARGDLIFSAGVNPFGNLALVSLGELVFCGKISNTFSLRIGGKMVFVARGESQPLTQFISSLRLVTHF